MSDRRLDVQITGEGRNLVLLHSLLSDRSSFGPIVSRIAGRRRLISVNLPGFGTSPSSGPAISDYAESVASTCEAMALPPETDVLGNGLGSFVALSLAARHGAKFDRLVLVGAAVTFPRAGKDTFIALAETVERDGVPAIVDIAMRRMFPEDFIAARPEVVAERAAVLRGIDTAVFASACRALAALDLGGDLPRIQNSTLIVVGEKDGATAPPLARELGARLANAEIVEMPGVGHCPHLQDPDGFIAAVAPFLDL